MRLTRIYPSTDPRGTLVGSCINPTRLGAICGRPVWSSTGYMDLDGEPYKSYYCARCGGALALGETISRAVSTA